MSNENQPHEVEKDQDSPNPDGKGFTRRRFIAGVAGAGMSIALAGNMTGQAAAQEAQESGPSQLDKTRSGALEPFIGDIMMVGFNFAPVGWALCAGQLLPIAGNEALFSLIGTTYGGDGEETFALPDLRGRLSAHQGQGPGRSNRILGEVAGQETVTLLMSQMPQHNHMVNAQSGTGNSTSPTGNFPASSSAQDRMYSSSTNNAPMNSNEIRSTGGGQPHDNMSPFLTINFIIALEGLFPSPN